MITGFCVAVRLAACWFIDAIQLARGTEPPPHGIEGPEGRANGGKGTRSGAADDDQNPAKGQHSQESNQVDPGI
jgi:hypothetical protein